MISAIAVHAASDSSQKLKSLLSQVESATVQRGWVDSEMAFDNPHILKKMPGYLDLQNEIVALGPNVMDELESVAPSSMAKAIFMVTLQALPPESYLKVLDKSVELAEKGKLEKPLLYWALFPQQKNVRGILSENYKQPEVIRIVNRSKVLFANDKIRVGFFDAILSGEVKKNDDKLFDDGAFGNKPKSFGTEPKSSASAQMAKPSVTLGASTTVPQPSPGKSERPTPKEEVPLSVSWLYSLVAIVLGGLGYVFYRGRKR